MARVWFLIGVLFFLGSSARAQAPDSVFLEELTWTELRDLVKSGKTTIIVPIGGTEQNGEHMALGKHNRRVYLLSEKIARSWATLLSHRPSPMCRRAASIRRPNTCGF